MKLCQNCNHDVKISYEIIFSKIWTKKRILLKCLVVTLVVNYIVVGHKLINGLFCQNSLNFLENLDYEKFLDVFFVRLATINA